MKNLLIALGCIFMFSISSCVKQKKCDCDMKGKFVYFEKPEEIVYCGNKCNVNAAIIPDGLTEEEASHGYYSRYNIVGTVPKEFRTKDTFKVFVCLKEEKRGICRAMGVGTIYRLKCIEKED